MVHILGSWIEQFLVKELNPGQLVIIFYKSERTNTLIKLAKCKLKIDFGHCMLSLIHLI